MTGKFTYERNKKKPSEWEEDNGLQVTEFGWCKLQLHPCFGVLFLRIDSQTWLDLIEISVTLQCVCEAINTRQYSLVYPDLPLSSTCVANSILLVLHYRLNIEFILNENTYEMAITSVIKDMEVETSK